MLSLSSRRAWIEIEILDLPTSVLVSLSSRRAWIEMDIYNCYDNCYDESLSSRRAWIEI